MKPFKTLFVCEFITGGGLLGEDLPESLATEGALMRDALLSDLSELKSWQIISTLDSRLGSLVDHTECCKIYPEEDAWEIWRHCMATADAVWAIAPESNGVLLRMAAMAQSSQAQWLGPGLNAIEIATDKHQMARVLADAKLPIIPTFFYDEWMPDDGLWLVKPNDGAGCEATFVLNTAHAVKAWFSEDATRKLSHIIQPYMTGVPASVSVLGLKEQVVVLSCNLQTIRLQDGQLHYSGGVINGAADYWQALTNLVQQIKAVIPDLQGYFGVDVLLGSSNTDVPIIVEINPRLTTSYVYLRDALGCNPAQLVLETMLGGATDVSEVKRNRIEFKLEHAT
jgi:predicted ATP-grasp superfamily ATP-dependent carboligase